MLISHGSFSLTNVALLYVGILMGVALCVLCRGIFVVCLVENCILSRRDKHQVHMQDTRQDKAREGTDR